MTSNHLKRDQLLATVAHDLRSPLAAIIGNAQLLLAEADTKQRPRLEAIRRAAERMDRLARDLLDRESLRSGRLTLQCQPHPITDLIDEALHQHKPLARGRSLLLELRLPADLPPVLIDRDRILQVLANLIGNAMRFSPSGGRVSVSARCDAEWVEVAVQDEGDGVPPDDLPHLFERAWRGQDPKGQGNGLGLSIAQGIVASHGGRIWVESDPGRGSTFFFTLPTV